MDEKSDAHQDNGDSQDAARKEGKHNILMKKMCELMLDQYIGARELNVIAKSFFEQVRDLGDNIFLENASSPALNYAASGSSDALKTLAGTYSATLALVRDVSPQQVQTWQAQNNLAAEIETRAREVSKTIGLERPFASNFAHAYAQQVAADLQSLLALLASK